MMSKVLRFAAVAGAVLLASGCMKPTIKPAPAASGPAATTATYQAAVVPGTTTLPTGVIRINTASGSTVIGFGAPVQLIQIPDLAIPAGQYELRVWSQPQASDGGLTWGAMREDKVSGRVWLLSGSGQTWNWLELTSPK
jgi:hypothetical protein